MKNVNIMFKINNKHYKLMVGQTSISNIYLLYYKDKDTGYQIVNKCKLIEYIDNTAEDLITNMLYIKGKKRDKLLNEYYINVQGIRRPSLG